MPLTAVRLALAALLTAPALASAGTLTLDDELVSQEECVDRASQDVDLSWTFTSSTGSEIQLLASDESGCPDEDSDSDTVTTVLVDGITASTSGYYPTSSGSDLRLSEVMSAAGITSDACSASEDTRLYVCVRLLDSSGATVESASARLKLQVTAPPPPVIVSVTPGENALHVAWEAGDATDDAPASSETYEVFASAGGATVASGETSDTSLRVGGLEIGTTYDVQVVAYSEAGNPSAPSELAAGTPVSVTDFWEAYGQAGGSERGGCAQGPAGLASLAALAAAGLAARRRR